MSDKADAAGRLPLSEQAYNWRNTAPGDHVGWYPLNHDQFELLLNREDADVKKLRIGDFRLQTETVMVLDSCLQSLIRELEERMAKYNQVGYSTEDLAILAQIMHAQITNYQSLIVAALIRDLETDRALKRMRKARKEERKGKKK